MAKNDTPKSIRCSFCGKAQENVRKIVAGPGVYICDECVELCTSIIEAELYDDEKAGYASAVGVFMFFLIMLIALPINNYLRNHLDDEEERT